MQALLVGVAVSAGFLAVFSIVALPISLGARRLTEAIPWAGIVLGIVMAAVGVAVFLGKRVALSIRHSMTARRERRPKAMFLFGVGYGIASLGCTLPVFLALIGASLASRGTLAGLSAFGAYGLGMATVLVALSLGAALLRNGLAHRMRRLLPHMNRITGTFLFLVGLYLAYYWSRARFAAAGSLSDDPLVSFVQTFTNRVQVWAAAGGGRWMILGAGVVLAAAVIVAFWRQTPGSRLPYTGESEHAPEREEEVARLEKAASRP